MRNSPLSGLQDSATLWELPAMHSHRIAAPEDLCSARAGACLVWTTVTEAIPEVDAAPMPLDLLAIRMPVVAHFHPAEDRPFAAKIDGFVAVAAGAVAILHGPTAPSRNWLRPNALDNWLNDGLVQRGVGEGGEDLVSLMSFRGTGRRELRGQRLLLILASVISTTRLSCIQRRINLLFS